MKYGGRCRNAILEVLFSENVPTTNLPDADPNQKPLKPLRRKPKISTNMYMEWMKTEDPL